MADLKPIKTRTPKQFDSILKGALGLGLKERVDIVNELKASITKELAEIEQRAADAKKIVNGN